MWHARRRTSCLLFVGVGVCYILFIFVINPSIRRDLTRPHLLHTSFSFLSQRSSAILVTGCLGTLGTPLSLHLLQQGVTVICVDLLASRQNQTQLAEPELEYLTPQERQSILLLEAFPNFVYRQGDIRHPSSVENIFFIYQNLPPIVGVIHLALIKEEAVCNATPQYCEQVNIGGTQTLIRALQRISISMNATNRVPWLIMGSSQVSSYEDAREGSPQSSIFRRVLLQAEQVALTNDVPPCVNAIVLRFSQIYGSFRSEDRSLWFPHAVLNAIRKQPIYLPEYNKVDLLHIDDAIHATERAIITLQISSPTCISQALDIGSARARTMRDIKHALLAATNSRSIVVSLPISLEKSFHVPDIIPAQRVLGYYPQVDLVSGLEKYVALIHSDTMEYLRQFELAICHNETSSNWPPKHKWQRNSKRLADWAKNPPCEDFPFQENNVDVLKHTSEAPPICRNNWGGKEIKVYSMCDDIRAAIHFVEGWWHDSMIPMQQACGNDTPAADLPVCEYECTHPTICIQTGRCNCVEFGRCPSGRRARHPSLTTAFAENTGDVTKLFPLILTTLGQSIPRRYQDLKLHNVPPHNEKNFNFCRQPTKSVPFSAPARVMEAVNLIQVPREEAEYVVIPFFQGCTKDTALKDYISKARKYVKQENSEGRKKLPNFIWVAAHDWSRCFAWAWDSFKLRTKRLDRSLPEVRGSHLFTTNGDANMNCYDPSWDVVIPPEGVNGKELVSHAMGPLPTPRERTVNIFWSGTAKYHPIRKALLCGNLYQNLTTLNTVEVTDTPVDNYLLRLQQSRFCLVPRGVAGWTPRTFEVIAMGCIPVLISDYTIYPFQQLLDYSRFAIFVRQAEIPLLADILNSYSLHALEEMHLATRIVWRAFLYHPSLIPMDYGTLDLALRSLWLKIMERRAAA